MTVFESYQEVLEWRLLDLDFVKAISSSNYVISLLGEEGDMQPLARSCFPRGEMK